MAKYNNHKSHGLCNSCKNEKTVKCLTCMWIETNDDDNWQPKYCLKNKREEYQELNAQEIY